MIRTFENLLSKVSSYAISVRGAVVSAAMLLSCGVMSAADYIASIGIVAVKQGTVVNDELLGRYGYTSYVDFRTDGGAIFAPHRYIAYSTTTDPEQAVKDVIICTSGAKATITYQGRTYQRLATHTDLASTSLKDGALASERYLYFTTESLPHTTQVLTSLSGKDVSKAMLQDMQGESSVPTVDAQGNPVTDYYMLKADGSVAKYLLSSTEQIVKHDIHDGLCSGCSHCFIDYTTTDGMMLTPASITGFGAKLVGNTYAEGHGMLEFDAPVSVIPADAFNGEARLKTFVLPASVSIIGNAAFYQCMNFTSGVDFSRLKELTKVGDFAFYDCVNLTGGLDLSACTQLTIIGEGAFYQCSSMAGALRFPTGIQSIKAWAFNNCHGLKGEVNLSACTSLTLLGENAFAGCEGLKLPANMRGGAQALSLK